MKRKILTLILFIITMGSYAQSVGDLFVTMPDSLFPYLLPQQRSELLSLKRLDESSDATLRSSFQCDAVVRTLTDERLVVTLDTLLTLEMQRLAVAGDADSVVCVLLTVPVPEPMTEAYIYNKMWNMLRRIDLSDVVCVQKPDTMSVSEYEEALRLIEFPIMSATFGEGPTLQVEQHVPLIHKSERTLTDAILSKRELLWNGENF